MGAVGVGVRHEDDLAVAGRVEVEACGRSPAPTTWMIEAHSAFFSMSPTEAFCTLRILPRIGSSAWNSESRASLAVPSAESPSTMNSSARSTSVLRQSTSLAGSDDDSSAFLRRCASRCCRAATRARDAPTTFSSTARAWPSDARLGRGEECGQLTLDRPGHQPRHRRRTQHLLGLTLELRLGQSYGHDRCQPLHHVVLDHLLPRLEQPGVLQGARHRPGQRALEAGDVGATLRGGDDVDERLHVGVVAVAPAHGDVDVEVRSTSRGSMCPSSSSIGTVSVNRSCPCSRITSVTAWSVARYSQNSEIPPSCRKVSSVTSLVRASITSGPDRAPGSWSAAPGSCRSFSDSCASRGRSADPASRSPGCRSPPSARPTLRSAGRRG